MNASLGQLLAPFADASAGIVGILDAFGIAAGNGLPNPYQEHNLHEHYTLTIAHES